MAITVENVMDAKNNAVKAHCGTCYKVLEKDEEGLDDYNEDEAVTFMLSVAERHVRKHPSHTPKVYVYHKKPRGEMVP